MLLIDASNVNSGGGETLLKYLIESLEAKNKNYFVICDPRWKDNIIPCNKNDVVKVNPFNRNSVLRKYVKLKSPKTFLCFGNFPPPFNVNGDVRTITYIQNAFIVNWENSKYLGFFLRIYLALTRLYIYVNKKNTQYFCFQNNITKNDFVKSYGGSTKTDYLVLPFFKIKNLESTIPFDQREDAFIYVSSDMVHKNHKNLFEAWRLNYEKGIKNILYVTLNEDRNSETVNLFKSMKLAGIPVVNLGILSHDMVLEKCNKVKYAIFPSFTETIGLNLVESSLAGCKVLTTDLEYVSEVIFPSLTFDPYSPLDIAKKVQTAIQTELPFPKVNMKNKIDDFIKLLF